MSNSLVRAELEKDSISVVKLVALIVEEAQSRRASDIHIDTQSAALRVRYRIDGQLDDFYLVPKRLHQELISRIKILAALRTDEHQSPQDGRFRLVLENRPVDIRVSVAPTYYGENAVLRLLCDNAEAFTLKTLGFSEKNVAKIQQALKKPYGMILATGPTGSGKTTALYALLKILNTKDSAIITIEDPIEYAVDGIQQIQVNSHAGLSFASGLRGILRQDPNIIMVGEIRDPETASIAVNAALTGHLLLSTLHTNDAATTLPRLLDMKIESYLVASTINAVIGQRLVRKICPSCKLEKHITSAEMESLGNVISEETLLSADKFYFGQGCAECGNTGYSGRVGIHEVIIPDPEIRDAILSKNSSARIKTIAIKKGMSSMIEDGFAKAKLKWS